MTEQIAKLLVVSMNTDMEPRRVELDLTPEECMVPAKMRGAVARHLHLPESVLGEVHMVRRTLDCRRRNVLYHCVVEVGGGERRVEHGERTPQLITHNSKLKTHNSKLKTHNSELITRKVVIVGAGPAGLFAALRCLQLGMKPVIVERGKPVEERKYDIARLAREKVVNPDSNWCFGEGGAGTYSDGKLYTRSTKRGDVSAVLRTFVEHGADPDILLEAHAHIGTDRLSGIIANMRHTIEAAGGEYHFNTRVTDLVVKDGRVYGVITEDGEIFGDAVILATGHSARDIYYMFQRHGWLLEAKPFALGVRVEHPQELINEIQYHGKGYSKYLPPAAYSLTTQVGVRATNGSNRANQTHGVFSFCMCPGGVIVPAATADGQQVVNGMSNSRRNSPFANSGIAVTVGLEDVAPAPYPLTTDHYPLSTDHYPLTTDHYPLSTNHYPLSTDHYPLSTDHSPLTTDHYPLTTNHSPLSTLAFQMQVEQIMFHAGGDAINAPAQRLVDFLRRKSSSTLGKTGYMGDVVSAPLHELLPPFVVDSLIQGFRDFDRKMHGFITEEATLLAVESRTSSPVRIPRDKETLQHPQLQGLYPCGEGAGYAGGIVSSALDGIRCVNNLANIG